MKEKSKNEIRDYHIGTPNTSIRFKSVKHAEYEILLALRSNKNDLPFSVAIDNVWSRGIPDGDSVAETRFRKAASNISTILRNMQLKRASSLPEEHPDYGEMV